MITYFFYSIFKITLIAKSEQSMEDTTVEQRMNDILSIMISLSNMIMLYGVSDSIKSSVDRQVREERILSTLDELISSENSSSETSDDKSLEQYLGTSGKNSRKKKRKSKKQEQTLIESSTVSTDGNIKLFNYQKRVIN